MPDPKMDNAPIVRPTQCRLNGHTFIWAAVWWVTEPLPETRCDCGLYTWEEWKKVQDE